MIRLFRIIRDDKIRLVIKQPGMTIKKARFVFGWKVISIYRALAHIRKTSTDTRR
jgi:hypothetical protein